MPNDRKIAQNVKQELLLVCIYVWFVGTPCPGPKMCCLIWNQARKPDCEIFGVRAVGKVFNDGPDDNQDPKNPGNGKPRNPH